MAQFLQNFADKLPHLAQRMLRGNAPFRVDVREHPALIEKSSTHRKSSRRISGKSESPPLHSGEVFPQTAREDAEKQWQLNIRGHTSSPPFSGAHFTLTLAALCQLSICLPCFFQDTLPSGHRLISPQNDIDI